MELVCAALTAIVVGLTFVVSLQRTKMKEFIEKNEKFYRFESLYHESLLENAKLKERCEQLYGITVSYDALREKYTELERNFTFLSANLEQERKSFSEKIKLMQDAEQKLSNTFKAISSDALSQNNQTFLDLAKSVFGQLQEKAKAEFSIGTKSVDELVSPIKTTLENVGLQLNELEKNRIGAYEALKQQVGDLIATQNLLKAETHNLASALRVPTIRGRWGEMQLRRVVELAGMMEHCDFCEQVSFTDGDNRIRPDMVILLPGNQQIIVDAKAPLSAYLEALDADDEKSRKSLLRDHAKQLKSHVTALASKKYWMQFQPGPEFVILFLPGEIFFSIASETDPSLIEFAMKERVIIATPTTLLALLHTIALGWRQENLSEEAKMIMKMGQELYKRLSDMTQHMFDLGKSIHSAVQKYNLTAASMENRVLSTARKFKNLETHGKNIIELSVIEDNARQLRKS
ncbi:MAG: DNA recombination protein RmuC [Holosporaceae bacterium]|jgi:DNA recombination protein RmuC|nr:DNA recombination protein RmuC [Holosporaceae bacterium]